MVRTVERGMVWSAWGVWACRAASSMLVGCRRCCCSDRGNCDDDVDVAERFTGQPPPPSETPLWRLPTAVDDEVVESPVVVDGGVAERRSQDVHEVRFPAVGFCDADEGERFTGQPPPPPPALFSSER